MARPAPGTASTHGNSNRPSTRPRVPDARTETRPAARRPCPCRWPRNHMTDCPLCDGECQDARLLPLLGDDLLWLWEQFAAIADRRGDPAMANGTFTVKAPAAPEERAAALGFFPGRPLIADQSRRLSLAELSAAVRRTGRCLPRAPSPRTPSDGSWPSALGAVTTGTDSSGALPPSATPGQRRRARESQPCGRQRCRVCTRQGEWRGCTRPTMQTECSGRRSRCLMRCHTRERGWTAECSPATLHATRTP